MLIYKKSEDAIIDAFINPVNCRGVMGNGLAKEVKRLFPNVFKIYREKCLADEFHIGTIQIVSTGDTLVKYIINFPTKYNWNKPSKLEYIEIGLINLLKELENYPNINTILIPKLGCGLGGLDWSEVESIFKNILTTSSKKFIVSS